MTLKIGINGLGRIGRCVLRAYASAPEGSFSGIELVAVNGPADSATHAHLLKYDSVHGTFQGNVAASETSITMAGTTVKLFKEREPEKIDWAGVGVDIVLECTGKFTKRAEAERHLTGPRGAKKVIISAPSPDAEATIVYGVNNAAITTEMRVISVGSCTTNCLAPIAKTLNDALGIESGFMTTIHSYTNDQVVLDGNHKDLRRARASALSMIPTSTGAAKALGLVIPELKGKLSGTAIRVPTPNVSMIDLCFNAAKATSVEKINALMRKASEGGLKGVLGYCVEELVSTDFNHNPFSAVFDATQTFVVGDRFARVAAWYDNEWGFSLRMLDVAKLLAEK